MELIVGFNLSSYSHCTSYTRSTTDTGNCCRVCNWPFIKNTYIVISYSRLGSRGNNYSTENVCEWFIILKIVATLVKVSQRRFS